MLISCRRSRNATRREERPGLPASTLVPCSATMPSAHGGLQDLLLLRVPLEAGLRVEVLLRQLRREEDQAGVRLGRAREPAGDPVEVHLHHGVEALEVGLLVYGEVYLV